MSLRLVQLEDGLDRRVARVDEPHLRFLSGTASVYALAEAALVSGMSLSEVVQRRATTDHVDYDDVYHGRSRWRLRVPLDHPEEPSRCLVSGTGLTHLGSARNRAAMHDPAGEPETDSMKMFRAGASGGRPAPGSVGVPPEWFYKGTGSILRAHGEPLVVPPYAEDGGEEAEIAGVYLVGPDGYPWRVGFAVGNEFSDHAFERRNYLNLAASKMRTCALGPELVVGAPFARVPGRVALERDGHVRWSQEVATGEEEMVHSLRNIEHHHFKFESHRRAGDVHVHFFGAHSLSCGAGVRVAPGDVMEIEFKGFGRPLRNPLRRDEGPEVPLEVGVLA
jgi:hypothetical protein